MDKLLDKHVFIFNPKDNGGEQLVLTTEFYDNGDGIPEGVYTSQQLSLQSYCNSANFELMGCSITSEILRKLANELDAVKSRLGSK